jgi:hypothetical protein
MTTTTVNGETYCEQCYADVQPGQRCPVCDPAPAAGDAVRAVETARAQVATTAPPVPETRPAGTVATRTGIDGAFLLGQTRKFINRYAVMTETQSTAVTLWVGASHFRTEAGSLVWREFPRLGFFSSEPGSGKTRCLELLQLLCPAAPSIETEPSEPAVALMIAKEHRTLLLDEGDVLFGAGKRKAAVRAIINAGYKRGGTWSRVRSGKVESVPVYGALALAGLDHMEKGTGSALEALMQRFIKIRLHKAKGRQPHKFREIVGEDPQGNPVDGEDVAGRIRELWAAYAAQEWAALAALTPQMPPGVELRQEELWWAMLALSQHCGEVWRDLGWEACEDIGLYGGTPDTVAEDLDMLASLGWED